MSFQTSGLLLFICLWPVYPLVTQSKCNLQRSPHLCSFLAQWIIYCFSRKFKSISFVPGLGVDRCTRKIAALRALTVKEAKRLIIKHIVTIYSLEHDHKYPLQFQCTQKGMLSILKPISPGSSFSFSAHPSSCLVVELKKKKLHLSIQGISLCLGINRIFKINTVCSG